MQRIGASATNLLPDPPNSQKKQNPVAAPHFRRVFTGAANAHSTFEEHVPAKVTMTAAYPRVDAGTSTGSNHWQLRIRPMARNFEKPPLPEWLLKRFMDDEQARYMYCSHGCIRVSKQNITKLFQVTTQPRLMNIPLTIVIS